MVLTSIFKTVKDYTVMDYRV